MGVYGKTEAQKQYLLKRANLPLFLHRLFSFGGGGFRLLLFLVVRAAVAKRTGGSLSSFRFDVSSSHVADLRYEVCVL